MIELGGLKILQLLAGAVQAGAVDQAALQILMKLVIRMIITQGVGQKPGEHGLARHKAGGAQLIHRHPAKGHERPFQAQNQIGFHAAPPARATTLSTWAANWGKGRAVAPGIRGWGLMLACQRVSWGPYMASMPVI